MAAVLTEVVDRVLVVTLNRPDARNAIDGELAAQLVDAVAELDSNPLLSTGVVTGAGRGFCSGMDLKAFAKAGVPKGLLSLMRSGAGKPLVAAVEGFAFAGGLELALACDLIVASKGARFGIPEVAVGLMAAGGGLVRLPRRLPPAVALEMALTGDPLTAEEAYRHGLVSRLTDKSMALSEALRLAIRIAANAPLSVAASRNVVRFATSHSEDETWEHQKALSSAVFSSDDAREGPRAFAEKRQPRWSGA